MNGLQRMNSMRRECFNQYRKRDVNFKVFNELDCYNYDNTLINVFPDLFTEFASNVIQCLRLIQKSMPT